MNGFGYLILVTLSAITIAFSSSLATNQTSSGNLSGTDLQKQQHLQHQQQSQLQPYSNAQQQQRQMHRQRNRHHHHHPHERRRLRDEVRQLHVNKTAEETMQKQQFRQQQFREQQLREQQSKHQQQPLHLQQQPQQQQQQQQQQHHRQHRRNATATTSRMRRISARDYYNQVTQRRPQLGNDAVTGGTSQWSYNNNNNNNNNNDNVQTNSFDGGYNVVGQAAGKGDDNTRDVEFIDSSSSNRHEWGGAPLPPTTTTTAATPTLARRGYGYVRTASPSVIQRRALFGPASATDAPPPLVPPRRGYATTAPAATQPAGDPHTTEDPFEGNTIGRNYPNDPHDMERRHICVQQRTIQMPVKTTEVYTRAFWKHISTPCQPQTHINQMCTRVQLVHEPAYRDVIRHKSAQQVTYDCCAGWMREQPHMDACMMPVCSIRCQNGGSCSSPDVCTCPVGFTGRYCEHDINECKEEKPCDQTCINTVGSFHCKCRDGFVLQPDQQSCKKVDLQDGDAFEARDLENEIESSDDVAARLQKIERSLANERVQTHELEKSLQATYHVVDSLKTRLTTLEKQHQDVSRLQSSLYATESRTNRLEGMLNLLMKCKNAPNAHCP